MSAPTLSPTTAVPRSVFEIIEKNPWLSLVGFLVVFFVLILFSVLIYGCLRRLGCLPNGCKRCDGMCGLLESSKNERRRKSHARRREQLSHLKEVDLDATRARGRFSSRDRGHDSWVRSSATVNSDIEVVVGSHRSRESGRGSQRINSNSSHQSPIQHQPVAVAIMVDMPSDRVAPNLNASPSSTTSSDSRRSRRRKHTTSSSSSSSSPSSVAGANEPRVSRSSTSSSSAPKTSNKTALINVNLSDGSKSTTGLNVATGASTSTTTKAPLVVAGSDVSAFNLLHRPQPSSITGAMNALATSPSAGARSRSPPKPHNAVPTVRRQHGKAPMDGKHAIVDPVVYDLLTSAIMEAEEATGASPARAGDDADAFWATYADEKKEQEDKLKVPWFAPLVEEDEGDTASVISGKRRSANGMKQQLQTALDAKNQIKTIHSTASSDADENTDDDSSSGSEGDSSSSDSSDGTRDVSSNSISSEVAATNAADDVAWGAMARFSRATEGSVSTTSSLSTQEEVDIFREDSIEDPPIRVLPELNTDVNGNLFVRVQRGIETYAVMLTPSQVISGSDAVSAEQQARIAADFERPSPPQLPEPTDAPTSQQKAADASKRKSRLGFKALRRSKSREHRSSSLGNNSGMSSPASPLASPVEPHVQPPDFPELDPVFEVDKDKERRRSALNQTWDVAVTGGRSRTRGSSLVDVDLSAFDYYFRQSDNLRSSMRGDEGQQQRRRTRGKSVDRRGASSRDSSSSKQ